VSVLHLVDDAHPPLSDDAQRAVSAADRFRKVRRGHTSSLRSRGIVRARFGAVNDATARAAPECAREVLLMRRGSCGATLSEVT